MKKSMYYFDIIASIIQKLLNSNIEPEFFSTYIKRDRLEQQFMRDCNFSNVEFEAKRLIACDDTLEVLYGLILCMNLLEELALKMWENESSKEFDSLNYIISFSSLNSKESVTVTGIVLLPSTNSIWEGKSRNEYHARSWNNFLNKTSFILDKDRCKYELMFHQIDPKLFDIRKVDENGFMYIRLAASPVSCDYSCRTHYMCLKDTRFLVVDSVDSNSVDDSYEQILNIIRKANDDIDENDHGIDILVFPEMLGTKELTSYICDSLLEVPADRIKIIVLPSIWHYFEEKKMGENYCDVITGDGGWLFAQHKLKRYIHNDNGIKSQELIDPNQTIHILFIKNVGAICILICVSELITELRHFIQDKLGVNLILSPSYASGGYEFLRSAMAGAELDCNLVWCNTCSALKESGVVCAITNYTKNQNYNNNLNIEGGKQSLIGLSCDKRCQRGGACIFDSALYAASIEERRESNE